MAADDHTMEPVRVLVVDDAPEIRLLLSLTFSADERFEVVGQAEDGPEAVAKAAETRPDLVVLDQTMPGPTGLEVVPDILDRAPSAAVVIYTAGLTPLRRQAVAAGAADVVDKLTVGSDLVERLVSILARRRQSPGRVIDLDCLSQTRAPAPQRTRP